MVKLFSDEEMLKKCELYKPIPLALEQKILHYEGNPDNVSILNGVIKSPFKVGQPVSNVTDYAYQLAFNVPINPENFLDVYKKELDKKIDKDVKQVMNELLEKIEMENEIVADIVSTPAEAVPAEDVPVQVAIPKMEEVPGEDEDRLPEPEKPKRTRRTKAQMKEAREMDQQDYSEL